MSIAVSEILDLAFGYLGVDAVSETPNGSDAKRGLLFLRYLLNEWSVKPMRNMYDLNVATTATTNQSITLGCSDRTILAGTKYNVTPALDSAGFYYQLIKRINGVTYYSYSTLGAGATYSIVATQSDAGTYYQTSTGYKQVAPGVVGDIFQTPAKLTQVQVETGNFPQSIPIVPFSSYMLQPSKNLAAGMPNQCAWDRTMPITTLYFFPMVAAGFTIRVIGLPSLGYPTTTQDVLTIDDLYLQPLITSLALRMYPYYPVAGQTEADSELVYQTKMAMQVLEDECRPRRMKRLQSPLGTGGWDSTWTSPYAPPLGVA